MLKEDTKEILANAFLQLVETKDLNKITVSDIVSVCHASRQTFYNHFNDKEELISWIYLHETENILQQLNEGLTYAECLHTILVGIEKKKFFYIKAYRMKEQNSLIESAVAHAQTYYRKTIERNQGKPLTEEQAFSINFITYGAIFAVRDQIRSSNMLSASKMANCIINNIPESMQNLIK